MTIEQTIETTNTPQPNSASAQPALVPLEESRRYRKRAQAAEQNVVELQASLMQKESQLREQQDRLAQYERSSRIDAALIDADVIDLDTARLLVDRIMTKEGESADAASIETAVALLRGRKPFLFREAAMASGVMSPRVEQRRVSDAERAANDAHASGSRTDLLRYLRLRRRN